MEASSGSRVPERVSTGIAGLDTVLGGGLSRGGTYAIVGQPGTGKTILGNQIAFHHAATGGQIIYLTLLTESHGRMLAHLQSLSFFDAARVGDTLYYLSGYSVLEQAGLAGLLDFIRRVHRQRSATLLVVDGIGIVRTYAESDLAFKRFFHELQVYAEIAGCTTLLLNSLTRGEVAVEGGLVDGLIELDEDVAGLRSVRELHVRKSRGGPILRGRHGFEITPRGIAVYPRTEARFASPAVPVGGSRQVLEFGIAGFDQMLGGGVLSGSSTMLLGSPGAGKTLFGLHFLAEGARRGEPGLHFGFYEPPDRLIAKADAVGLGLGEQVASGRIAIVWQPSLEQHLDALAERLLSDVQRLGVRRLAVDGLDAFESAALYPERLGRFFTALIHELRGRGVTTLCSLETEALFGPQIEVPLTRATEVVDNIVFLRYVELRSQLYRLVSILKARESRHDTAIREFTITPQGIAVAETFESAEAILTGIARRLPPTIDAVSPGPETDRGPTAE